MAKISAERWLKAKALYEAGQKLKYIETHTDISIPALSLKSKKEGWIKSANEPLIYADIMLTESKHNLTDMEIKIHNEEVIRLTKFGASLNLFSVKAMEKANVLLTNSDNGNDFKAVIDAVDRHSMTVGYNKRHATSNINMQQGQQSTAPVTLNVEGV